LRRCSLGGGSVARGTVNGEQVVSQANSESFRSGYDRAFGARKPQRGVWVATPTGLVSAGEYTPPPSKAGTTLVSGRWHEGQRAPDGTDIGTPAKRRAWMKRTGTADYDDYRGVRARKAAELEARHRGETKPDKSLRDLIGRELYKQKVIL
jgi:hypothetical protein